VAENTLAGGVQAGAFMVCVNDTLATLSDNTGALGVHVK
jgi:hypothetical protein